MRNHSILYVLIFLAVSSCTSHSFESDFRKAEADLGVGKVKPAIAEYESIVEKYKDHKQRPAVLLKLAKLKELAGGDKGGAIKVYNRIVKEYSQSEFAKVALEERALLSHEMGNPESAIEDVTLLMKLFPDEGEVFRYRVLLGNIYLSMGKYSQARIEISPVVKDDVIRLVQGDVLEQAVFTYAESLFLEDRLADAVNWYNAFIDNFPKSKNVDEARLHLATCLEEMGHLGAARAVTEKAKNYPNRKVIDLRLKSIGERGSETPPALPKGRK